MANPLHAYLDATGTTQEEFARLIDATQPQVSRYARWGTGAKDARRPSRRIRRTIEEQTNGAVPASAWDAKRSRRRPSTPPASP